MTKISAGWEVIWQVDRDICFLYHLLAEFPGIDGDQAYGHLFILPYWEFLDLDLEEDESRFVREGCLVMILAMAWDLLDGSGTYLQPHLEACLAAVRAVDEADVRTARLVRTVLRALDSAQRGERATEDLRREAVWVNRTFVLGYFQKLAASLDAAHRQLGVSSTPEGAP